MTYRKKALFKDGIVNTLEELVDAPVLEPDALSLHDRFSLMFTGKEQYRVGHAYHVWMVANMIAEETGIRGNRLLDQISRAALLHDIGSVRESYVFSQTPLAADDADSPEEREIKQQFRAEFGRSMTEHPMRGAEICRRYELSGVERSAIQDHHKLNFGDARGMGRAGQIVALAEILSGALKETPYSTPSKSVEELCREIDGFLIDHDIAQSVVGLLRGGKLKISDSPESFETFSRHYHARRMDLAETILFNEVFRDRADYEKGYFKASRAVLDPEQLAVLQTDQVAAKKALHSYLGFLLEKFIQCTPFERGVLWAYRKWDEIKDESFDLSMLADHFGPEELQGIILPRHRIAAFESALSSDVSNSQLGSYMAEHIKGQKSEEKIETIRLLDDIILPTYRQKAYQILVAYKRASEAGIDEGSLDSFVRDELKKMRTQALGIDEVRSIIDGRYDLGRYSECRIEEPAGENAEDNMGNNDITGLLVREVSKQVQNAMDFGILVPRNFAGRPGNSDDAGLELGLLSNAFYTLEEQDWGKGCVEDRPFECISLARGIPGVVCHKTGYDPRSIIGDIKKNLEAAGDHEHDKFSAAYNDCFMIPIFRNDSEGNRIMYGLITADSPVYRPLIGPEEIMIGKYFADRAANGFTLATDIHRIKSALARMVDPSVMEEIIRLGERSHELFMPKAITATILESDVRGFTTATEENTSQPEIITEFLSAYMSRCFSTIKENLGTIDKTIGDAIMADFGWPIQKPDDAYRAVLAAVKMQNEMKGLEKERESKGLLYRPIGIGINTGRMIAGPLGVTGIYEDFTVIGDAVNLGARLCDLAGKTHPDTGEKMPDILISRFTYDAMRSDGSFDENSFPADIVPLAPLKVKGKKELIPIYGVIPK
ncbi:HDIG domain-containing protein [Candidatus Woesearchaeota archaeon]|nr:HDIG domain-containing protein [Candidatus Woesearchaeota archaeon]